MVGDVSATDLGDVAATFSVELDGDHMHGLFKTHGVKILFYCGFATNWCVMDRPAAIRDMAGRGYGCVLLCDATAGLEQSDTIDGLLNTRAFVDQIELRSGYSVLTDDFIAACLAQPRE